MNISIEELFNIISGNASKKSWEYIFFSFRLPKAITAILTGAGISLAGLQMQTLFKNPLAGPSVLGISHGASLGVAVFVLSSTAFFGVSTTFQETLGSWGLVLFAVAGSFLVLLSVLFASVRLSDSVTVLIVGLMFGFITGAVVNILQYFSDPELIQSFMVWTFGSLSGVAWSQLQVMGPIILLTLLLSLLYSKQMNALLLGDNYAAGVGVTVGVEVAVGEAVVVGVAVLELLLPPPQLASSVVAKIIRQVCRCFAACVVLIFKIFTVFFPRCAVQYYCSAL